MRLQRLGKHISKAEVQNISPNGIWLLVTGTEYFLPYEEYPWFKNAKVSEICDVELLHERHLHWPHLDIDLDVEPLGGLK